MDTIKKVKIEILGGITITEAIRDCIILAKLTEAIVYFKFNNVKLYAVKDIDPAIIESVYTYKLGK